MIKKQNLNRIKKISSYFLSMIQIMIWVLMLMLNTFEYKWHEWLYYIFNIYILLNLRYENRVVKKKWIRRRRRRRDYMNDMKLTYC
jgi:hypothetical protein